MSESIGKMTHNMMSEQKAQLLIEQEADRKEYNCAVANGLIGTARRIDRRMKSRALKIRRL